MPSMKYSTGDPYTYPESTVLINLADLRSQDELDRFEAQAVYLRSIQLMVRPTPSVFDVALLKATHLYQFQDVYAWAGQFRTVNISKGSTPFGSYQYLEAHLDTVMRRLARSEYLVGRDDVVFISEIASCLGELNAAHPFRDGNGRAQREFIRALAAHAGFVIDWGQADRAELYRASEASMYGDLKPLTSVLGAITSRL